MATVVNLPPSKVPPPRNKALQNPYFKGGARLVGSVDQSLSFGRAQMTYFVLLLLNMVLGASSSHISRG